ncbi:hypothetical protein M900_1876 [Bacteriovorax sp. Seq25_V]|nr:hypothetical protein M900_1876 [Bacteriovorax sp. Seq25_V]
MKQVEHIQFDDLITIEHTKMKPLSVSMVVNAKNRSILGFRVARIPANGLLAEKSRRKYGKRKSEHLRELRSLFGEIKNCVKPNALVQSDDHSVYNSVVRTYLPQATHQQFIGGRGCSTGQGELKRLRFDPIFTLNHNFAMLRDGIGKLIRKTWGTTKCPDALRNIWKFICVITMRIWEC